ncbi:hypothetical protein YPPY32_1374, partial [Yersinia pestis PY-32]
MEGEYPPPPFF